MNQAKGQPIVVTSGLRDLVLWTMVVAISAAATHLHLAASLTLPVPWGDEAYFVWQARAFERWNSFVAPELDSSRPIFLLPFVYGATLGIVFKVFGYSLEIARWLSFAFVLASLGFLSFLVRRHAAPVLALAAVGLLVLNKFFIVMGNVARMEALVIAIVCGALLLMQRGRLWTAVALVSVLPMIHPNGMYFLIPLIVYTVARGLLNERPERLAVSIFLLSALVWVANGLYALSYWDGFLHDTAYRFGESSARHEGWSQFRGWAVAELGLISATAALGAWRRVPIGHLLIVALGAWLANYVRLEQWYEPYRDLAYLLISLALMEVAARGFAWAPLANVRWYRAVAVGVVAAGLLLLALHNGRIDGPRNYVDDLRVSGMRAESDVVYFAPDDRKAIQSTLDSLKQNCSVIVEVYPWGDALLLAESAERKVRFQVPYFDPFFQPSERWIWGYQATKSALPDLYLVHLSRYHPRWLNDRQDRFLAHVAKRSGAGSTIVHSRDGTEIWYAFVPTAKAKSAQSAVSNRGC